LIIEPLKNQPAQKINACAGCLYVGIIKIVMIGAVRAGFTQSKENKYDTNK
jgi:hypothetical protein